jgi:hypothetical protein
MRVRYVVTWALSGLVLLGVVGYVAIPTMSGLVNRVVRDGATEIRRFFAPTPVAVRPVEAASSDAAADHPAFDAVDKRTDTWWQSTGERPAMTAMFQQPVGLWQVIVTTYKGPDYAEVRRPAKLTFTSDGGGSRTIDLQDVDTPQVFPLDLEGVGTVEVTIESTNGPAGAPIVLTELEFFTKN